MYGYSENNRHMFTLHTVCYPQQAVIHSSYIRRPLLPSAHVIAGSNLNHTEQPAIAYSEAAQLALSEEKLAKALDKIREMGAKFSNG